MKPAGLILAIVSGAGLLAVAAPGAFSQRSGYGASSFSSFDSGTYQSAEETAPVRAALNLFDYALSTHDVGMLQAAGVKRKNAKRWQRFFRNNPQATVTDQCPDSSLLISDNKASWTCMETATILSEGKPRAFQQVIRFTFAKDHGTWLVAGRE
jgi:hypothetical protein